MRIWKEEIENNADGNVLVYLVGNRADLGDTEEREVTTEEGVELMKELGCDSHMETSALTGYNIAWLFDKLTRHLYLVNESRLGEFRDDGAVTEGQAADRNSFALRPKNVDLYKPADKKKKKNCAC